MLRKSGLSSLKSAVSPVLEGLEQRRLMSGTLTLVNPDGLPSNNRLIFNVIQHPDSVTPNSTDSTSVLELENTGTSVLTINSITPSGPFALVNAPAAGTTIAAGSSLNVTVKFTQTTLPAHTLNETNFTTDPSGGAAINGSLVINSSDSVSPAQTVTLAGYWQNQSEHNNEPNLTTIVNTIAGYKTVISTPYEVDLTEPSTTRELYGSEVYSPTWAAANPAQPVKLQTLAEFHTEGNVVHTYWYSTNSTGGITSRLLTTSLPNQGQTLMPDTSGPQNSGGLATATFTPGQNFGLRVDNEYSNDATNVANNNSTGGDGHHFRFFPLVDSSGNTVPNTYIVAMDYAVIQSENFDFQDNLFILSNIRPTTTPPAPTSFTATSVAQPVLSWTPVTYAALGGYDVYRSTSLGGTYSLLTSSPITATTYTDTTAPGGVPVYYQVTAVDSSSGLQSQAATATANTPGGPVAVSDSVNAYSGQAVAVNVLGNDTDATGNIDPSTVTIVGQPNHGGTVSVNASTGVVTYTSAGGFSGTETFTYDERDNNGALSSPATVTVTVANVTNIAPTANDDTAVVLDNSSVVINVLANDEAGTTLVPGSVVVDGTPGGHASSNGSTTVNSDGTITYTPKANFIGFDSFTYTVTDANGLTSSSANVGVNVGVQITNVVRTGTKSISYTDGDATPVVITLSRGMAAVYFNGSGTASTSTKGGKITIANGSSLSVSNIVLTNTTAASALNITSKLGTVNVRGITDAGVLGAINAKTTNFTGVLSVAGLNSLTLKNVIGQSTGSPSQILVGSGVPHGPALLFAAVTDTSVTSAVPIRSLRATSWLNTVNDTISIAAPSLASLNVKGEFDPSLDLNGTGAATLGNAIIGGSLGTGYWSIGGTTRNVTIATAGSAWGATFGTLNALNIRSGGLSDDLNATTIGSLNITGDLTGSVTAVSARSIRISGAASGASLNFTGGVGKTFALTSLTIAGAVTASTITSAGNVNSIVVGSLSNSSILLDTTATSVSDVSAGNIGSAILHSLTVRSKAASAFSDSNVIAETILSASTGQVNAANGGTAEGLAAVTFKSLTVGADGGIVHLPAADLITQSALSAYLQSKGVSFGTFTIDIVTAA